MNLRKFQVTIFNKNKGNHTNEIINIDGKEVKAVLNVKLLEIKLDDKPNFNHYINNIFKPASKQLKTLIRLKHFLIFTEKKSLVNTFVMLKFHYCSLS